MIVRRWSDTVVAEYRDDGNPFGGYLVCVHETVDTQANERDSNAGSWENEGAPTLRAQDRSST